MIKIILVRHGSTNWTKEGRYQGSTDIPLSEEGIKQAKKLAKRLKKEKIDVAYTSKLKRAIDTAKEIIKFHDVKLIQTMELNERSYGKWEGLTKEEIEKKYADNRAAYEGERYKTRPLGGESFLDLRKRIEPFIKKLIEKNKDKAILIVSHNGPLRIIAGILMNYDKEKIAALYMQPTSLTVISLDNGKPTMHLMNCDKHNT